MTIRKFNWGILSTANIGVKNVIPAIQNSNYGVVKGIASRKAESARKAAAELGIEKHYGSYEDLINDEEIDIIYNPLPNHLHVELTKKCIEAGKHVLCEKPLSLNIEGVKELIALRDKHQVKVGEAFMVHTHPQWIDAVKRVKNNYLGPVKHIQSFFSYFMRDSDNIRNKPEYGGGGLWDIGVYPVHLSRYIFNAEPTRVMGHLINDPEMNVDYLASAILEFPGGRTASFTVSTQVTAFQKMNIFGEDKRLEIEIPFNAPNDKPSNVYIDTNFFKMSPEKIVFETCDQYSLQADAFMRSVAYDEPEPVTLENALWNTAIIQSIFASVKSGTWEVPVT